MLKRMWKRFAPSFFKDCLDKIINFLLLKRIFCYLAICYFIIRRSNSTSFQFFLDRIRFRIRIRIRATTKTEIPYRLKFRRLLILSVKKFRRLKVTKFF